MFDKIVTMAFNQNTLASLIIILCLGIIVFFIKYHLTKIKSNDDKHDEEIKALHKKISETKSELKETIENRIVQINAIATEVHKELRETESLISKTKEAIFADLREGPFRKISTTEQRINQLESKMNSDLGIFISKIDLEHKLFDTLKTVVDADHKAIADINSTIRDIINKKHEKVRELSDNINNAHSKIDNAISNHERSVAQLSLSLEKGQINSEQFHKELSKLKDANYTEVKNITESLVKLTAESVKLENITPLYDRINGIVSRLSTVEKIEATNNSNYDKLLTKMSLMQDRVMDIASKFETYRKTNDHDMKVLTQNVNLIITKLRNNIQKRE